MPTPRKTFQEGRTYYAEYVVTCFYKGYHNQIGADYIFAKCIRRTKCYATFEVQTSLGLLTKKGKLFPMDGGEMVHLTNNGRIKDLTIMSYQTAD